MLKIKFEEKVAGRLRYAIGMSGDDEGVEYGEHCAIVKIESPTDDFGEWLIDVLTLGDGKISATIEIED